MSNKNKIYEDKQEFETQEIEGILNKDGRYLYWDITSVNSNVGSRLLDLDGKPLKPKKIETWVEICHWSYGGGDIIHPEGRGHLPDGDDSNKFCVANVNELGVILYYDPKEMIVNPTFRDANGISTMNESEAELITWNIPDHHCLYTSVNDWYNSFGNNSGYYKLCMKNIT